MGISISMRSADGVQVPARLHLLEMFDWKAAGIMRVQRSVRVKQLPLGRLTPAANLPCLIIFWPCTSYSLGSESQTKWL